MQAATGDESEAFVHVERSGLARFARSEQHQPTLVENTVVTLRIVRGGSVGIAVTNRTSDDGLRDLAQRAAETAESARAEEDFPGLRAPAPLPDVEGYDEETAALGADGQARLAATAIGATGDWPGYGFFTSGVTHLAVASTTGLEAEQRLTDASLLVLASDEGADLLQAFSYDSLGALGLLEERSYFAGRLGKRLFDEKVSLVDDAIDPRGLPKSFDFEGSPKQRVALIERGVARGVVWDRRTAKRAGGDAHGTGHAPPVTWQSYGPLPFALSMAGGDAESIDELAELVGDGIYVTRLHYLGIVHPREGVITGMTRDGTFRIRGGMIAEPLVNLRFTVSVPKVLEDVPGLLRDVKLVNGSDFYGERYPQASLVPAIATAYFNVTGNGSTPGI